MAARIVTSGIWSARAHAHTETHCRNWNPMPATITRVTRPGPVAERDDAEVDRPEVAPPPGATDQPTGAAGVSGQPQERRAAPTRVTTLMRIAATVAAAEVEQDSGSQHQSRQPRSAAGPATRSGVRGWSTRTSRRSRRCPGPGASPAPRRRRPRSAARWTRTRPASRWENSRLNGRWMPRVSDTSAQRRVCST